MYRVKLPLLLLCVCALCLPAWTQENRIVIVGVPLMKNAAGRSVPPSLEQERLVSYLNHQKPDKKQHIALQGVPLEGTTPEEVAEQAKQKKCDYIVYTTLTELRGTQDSYQRPPGTIETNPGGVWSNPNNPRAQALEPEYRATVEYKLYRADGTAVSGAPFSYQQTGMETEVVAQIMDRIATKVFAEVKKGGGPPMQE